ncbi:Cytochrome c heme lyase subunit CcmL [hydrothermal vent metagenome]|uniref:Cytochrome c heme lyase subunit CcmL n=1 Tax=hydrothermal vent metagenome TaxID=652676 RepID=A0A3B0X9X2_9ZZZZ
MNNSNSVVVYQERFFWQKRAGFILLLLSFLVASLMFSSVASARFETHVFPSAQAEKDYAVLVQELRCLVCQNQNLADSNAELAQDMRLRVFKMLEEGKNREEVVEFMVSRYGDFVMYRPPIKSSTYLLWFGPLVFFFIAGVVVVFFMQRQKTGVQTEIDEEQQKKAHSLLDD